MSTGKWWPFWLGLNVFTPARAHSVSHIYIFCHIYPTTIPKMCWMPSMSYETIFHICHSCDLIMLDGMITTLVMTRKLFLHYGHLLRAPILTSGITSQSFCNAGIWGIFNVTMGRKSQGSSNFWYRGTVIYRIKPSHLVCYFNGVSGIDLLNSLL